MLVEPMSEANPQNQTKSSASASSAPSQKFVKTGRNLKLAIPVGIFLGAIVIVSLSISSLAWYVVVAGGCLVSLYEATRFLPRLNLWISPILIQILGQVMVWSSFFFRERGLLMAFIAAGLFLMLWQLFAQGMKNPPENYFRSVSVAIFLLVWIPLMLSCAGILIFDPHGVGRVLCFMIIAIGSDVGGYFSGILLGKHPMVPAISPKKTWEGLIGSIVFGTILSTISLHYLGFAWWLAVISGPVMVIIATCGDLVESQIKRDLFIKDMSNLLPGHGGLLDRLDSILLSAGAAWILWHLLI